MAKALYAIAEKIRYEKIGSNKLKGVKNNITQCYENKFKNKKIEEIKTEADVPITEAFELYLRSHFFKMKQNDTTEKVLSYWKNLFDKNLKQKLNELDSCIEKQNDFNQLIANLIDKSANSLKYDHSRIELSFMYSTLHKQGRLDIFTTNLLLDLAAYKKSYYTSLPIVLDGYSDKMLIKNVLNNDGFFLVNPYGSMSLTQENLKIFHNKLNKSDNLNQPKYPQDFYYENLMLLYFSGKLTNQYNFKKYKCIDLSHRNYVREGCLLIKNSIKSK